MAEDLGKVEQSAGEPKKVSGDSGSMEQHPLREQIEADRYLCSKKAAKKKGLPFKVSKLVPPGAS